MNSDYDKDNASKSSKRSFWFHIHFWLGWISAIPLILICLSGGFLAFSKYFKQWELPEQFNLTVTENPRTLDEVIEIYKSAQPRLSINHLALPKEENHAYGAYVSILDDSGKRNGGGYVIVNQYTGELMHRSEKFTLSSFMEKLHVNLTIEGWGKQIVSISSIILAITCLAGIILWWPMKGKTFQRVKNRGSALDWHNAVGLVSLVPLSIMAVTGVIMSYSELIFPFLDKFQNEPSRPPDPVVEFEPGLQKLPLSTPMAEVRKNFPDGMITGIQPTGSKNTPYKFFVNEKGRNYRICMDPYSGNELSRYDGSPTTPVGWFRKYYFRFHTLSFNTFTSSIWGILSFSGSILIISGILVSIKRWRRAAMSAKTP